MPLPEMRRQFNRFRAPEEILADESARAYLYESITLRMDRRAAADFGAVRVPGPPIIREKYLDEQEREECAARRERMFIAWVDYVA